MENSMGISQKTKNRATIWLSSSTPRYISKKTNPDSKRCMCPKVHRNLAYNCHSLKAISKPGFSNTRTENFQMFKLVLEKAEEPEIKLPTSAGSSKKQESSRKTSISALLTMPKPSTVWITINCGKFWKRWEYQTTWPASWETCMQVRKQQLELDMEQQTGPQQEKEYIKAEYCHPAYLTYMQNTSWEMLGWIKYKLESIFQGEISITSDMQMTPSL